MINILLEALRDTILITGLVTVMMLLIEYINIDSHGSAFEKLKSSSLKQVLTGAFLGLIPGCIGGFATVSLYTHRMLSFGALVAMMIVSTGDEAFIMLSLIPKTALILFTVLLCIGVVAGLIVDRFSKREIAPFEADSHFKLHDHCCGAHNDTAHSDSTHEHLHHSCDCAHDHNDQNSSGGIFGTSIAANFKKNSRQRVIIMVGIVLFIIAIAFGVLEHSHDAHSDHSHVTHDHIVLSETHNHQHAGHNHNHADGEAHTTHSHDNSSGTHTHNHNSAAHQNSHDTTITHSHEHHNHAHFDMFSERWLNLLFAVISLITLFLTAKANEHFIKEHLWNHVIKRHLPKIFLWTLGALTAIHFGMQYLDIESWMDENVYLIILLAALIGLIPESGPHMIFIAFFANGMVPFSVLLTSSIVQDGHTTLPLLAESKISFVKAKLINLTIGIAIGAAVQLLC